jgi:hypothetical protein
VNPRNRIWVLAGIVLTAAALLVAGCGEDEGDSGGGEAATTAKPEPPAAPTKQEYIAEADKICKEAQRDQADVVAELNKHLEALALERPPEEQQASATAAAKEYDALADTRDDVSQDLEALDEPEEGAAEDYLKSRERNTEALRESAKAFQAFANSPTQEASDAAGQAAKKTNSLGAEGEKLAEDYGFKVCGQPAK